MENLFIPKKIDERQIENKPKYIRHLIQLLKQKVVFGDICIQDYIIDEIKEFCNIKSLNNIEEVKGDIFLTKSYIENLNNLKTIHGSICLPECIKYAPKLQQIYGDLIFFDIINKKSIIDLSSIEYISGDIYLPRIDNKQKIIFSKNLNIKGSVFFFTREDIYYNSSYRARSFQEYLNHSNSISNLNEKKYKRKNRYFF